jgi:hypothetical protein
MMTQPPMPMHGDDLYSDGKSVPREIYSPGDGNHTSRPISDMTERELLEELVVSMRTVGAALATLQKVGPAGMIKSMMTGKFPV